MTIGWGYKIAILYGSFVVMMLCLVIRSSMEDFNMVSKDYYQQEVSYQQRIDQIHNSKALAQGLKIQANNEAVRISYPVMKSISGEVKLYRPADETRDKVVKVTPDAANEQVISTEGIPRGNWKVQVSWSAEGKSYFDEKVIYIN
jgi:nitrogen fixation protein FixH